MPLSGREIETALAAWSQLDGGSAHLVNHSENETFRVETPANGRFSLRLHRLGYQSPETIESELAWLSALRRETDLAIPEPISGRDGKLLQRVRTVSGEERLAVLFAFIPGEEPLPTSNLGDLFAELGRYAATMHRHAIGWERPKAFARQVWQAATILDADGLWGDWRTAPGVDKSTRIALDRLDSTLWQRLADYGTASHRYGLIHADMRLGNLLVDGNKVTLIDFDDCGFCWFAYDFAAAISFHETSPMMPALKAAWLQGYLAIRPLAPEDIVAMDSMVMLRRMALLAWIGSHAETGLAQTHMPGFAEGTVQLAERYLRGSIWSV